MTWSGTVDDAHRLGDKIRIVREEMTLTRQKKITGPDGQGTTVVEPIGALERQTTLRRSTWVGISESAAIAFATVAAGTANVEEVSAEPMNDAGAYQVVVQFSEPGAWA